MRNILLLILAVVALACNLFNVNYYKRRAVAWVFVFMSILMIFEIVMLTRAIVTG